MADTEISPIIEESPLKQEMTNNGVDCGKKDAMSVSIDGTEMNADETGGNPDDLDSRVEIKSSQDILQTPAGLEESQVQLMTKIEGVENEGLGDSSEVELQYSKHWESSAYVQNNEICSNNRDLESNDCCDSTLSSSSSSSSSSSTTKSSFFSSSKTILSADENEDCESIIGEKDSCHRNSTDSTRSSGVWKEIIEDFDSSRGDHKILRAIRRTATVNAVVAATATLGPIAAVAGYATGGVITAKRMGDGIAEDNPKEVAKSLAVFGSATSASLAGQAITGAVAIGVLGASLPLAGALAFGAGCVSGITAGALSEWGVEEVMKEEDSESSEEDESSHDVVTQKLMEDVSSTEHEKGGPQNKFVKACGAWVNRQKERHRQRQIERQKIINRRNGLTKSLTKLHHEQWPQSNARSSESSHNTNWTQQSSGSMLEN